MNVYVSQTTELEIQRLYLQGHSPREIKNNLNLSLSVRQLQRWIKAWGLSRSAGDGFRLAVIQGKVTYHRDPNKKKRKSIRPRLRTFILERDNYTCVKCGNTNEHARIQIDHIDNNPQNNLVDNLRTLCEPCNHGKRPRRRFKNEKWTEEKFVA